MMGRFVFLIFHCVIERFQRMTKMNFKKIAWRFPREFEALNTILRETRPYTRHQVLRNTSLREDVTDGRMDQWTDEQTLLQRCFRAHSHQPLVHFPDA